MNFLGQKINEFVLLNWVLISSGLSYLVLRQKRYRCSNFFSLFIRKQIVLGNRTRKRPLCWQAIAFLVKSCENSNQFFHTFQSSKLQNFGQQRWLSGKTLASLNPRSKVRIHPLVPGKEENGERNNTVTLRQAKLDRLSLAELNVCSRQTEHPSL